MKVHRVWVEIAFVGTSIACAIALLLATLGALAGLATAAAGQAANPAAEQTYEGVVTCSRCGARHSARIGKTAGDCARACVHAGEKFSLVNGEQNYRLEGDPVWLQRAAGERVSIPGLPRGNTIRVSSIKSL